ncbi:MAG: tail fiber domain-containing protein [Acidobacteria bacterium]|nr:tail fiber domain-containing protein [Acidobacteriota bacterium]MBI3421939.1 tail fiber domain-containing protein [Acidobacteriota bacterium]
MNHLSQADCKWAAWLSLMLLLAISVCATALAQTTAFTYQGKLTDAGNPATGAYDLQFRLFDALVSGNQVGTTLVREDVAVANGIFSVTLDFGAAAFSGANRWLEIGVRPGVSTGVFTALSPLQPITSTPYAVQSLNTMTAQNALQLGGVAANQYILTGDARLSDARPPTAGSANYIQNTTSPQAASNFNISGNGTLGGNLRANGGVTITGANGDGAVVTARRSGADAYVIIDATAASQNSVLAYRKNNFNRWLLFADNSAESGSNAGSNFRLDAYNDAGNGIGTHLFIQRASGYVGIGTTNPLVKLHVEGGNDTGIFAKSGANFGVHGESTSNYGVIGSSTLASGVAGQSSTGDGVFGRSNSGYGVYGLSSSGIGIQGQSDNNINGIAVSGLSTGSGTGVSGYSPGGFGVAGNTISGTGVYGDNGNSNTIGHAGYFNGRVGITGNLIVDGVFSNPSDARLKQQVKPLGYGLSQVLRLRPVTWKWKAQPEGQLQLGLIAQEVEDVLPELVQREADPAQPLGLNYLGLLPVAIRAIQEQQAQIAQYQKQLSAEQRRNDQQQAQLASQRGEIKALKQLVCANHRRAALCK